MCSFRFTRRPQKCDGCDSHRYGLHRRSDHHWPRQKPGASRRQHTGRPSGTTTHKVCECGQPEDRESDRSGGAHVAAVERRQGDRVRRVKALRRCFLAVALSNRFSPTADVPSRGLLTRMYGPAAFRKRYCAWTSSHFMSVRCRTASTTSSISNLKALNLQLCDQSEASGRPAIRSKLVFPDAPNGIPATITMLSPGFPKSPARAASRASFVIDASSVISFSTTTE